ncbi:MAG: hypothetical protein JXA72_00445 [Bacteroidales bacterium]|nr:hypothetical protein [Bacteroidales bacterium]
MHRIKINKLLFLSIFTFSLLFPSGILAGDSSNSLQKSRVVLNPVYKVKRMSNGTVIVSTTEKDGTIVKHEFRELYADLVMAAYRKQHLTTIVNNLSKKYYLSEDDCRREVKHALNELTEWKIVVRADKTP